MGEITDKTNSVKGTSMLILVDTWPARLTNRLCDLFSSQCTGQYRRVQI